MISHHGTLGSIVPDNGDQNPYAILVAPASAGSIQKDPSRLLDDVAWVGAEGPAIGQVLFET